jgi:hypothetical protein
LREIEQLSLDPLQQGPGFEIVRSGRLVVDREDGGLQLVLGAVDDFLEEQLSIRYFPFRAFDHTEIQAVLHACSPSWRA